MNTAQEFDFSIEKGLRSHFSKTFKWMTVGLLVAFLTAVALYLTNATLFLYSIPMMPLIMFIAQIAVVVSFTKSVSSMSVDKAKNMFMFYSVLSGITFSVFGYAYSARAISVAFGVSVLYFAMLAVIGDITKINMFKFRNLFFVSLILLIVFEIIALLTGVFTQFEMVFCTLGLLLFTGITIYDVQKMKVLYLNHQYDEDAVNSLAVYSAFELYLDFINIFIYILRIIGRRD